MRHFYSVCFFHEKIAYMHSLTNCLPFPILEFSKNSYFHRKKIGFMKCYRFICCIKFATFPICKNFIIFFSKNSIFPRKKSYSRTYWRNPTSLFAFCGKFAVINRWKTFKVGISCNRALAVKRIKKLCMHFFLPYIKYCGK